jgi:hypothetical protein
MLSAAKEVRYPVREFAEHAFQKHQISQSGNEHQHASDILAGVGSISLEQDVKREEWNSRTSRSAYHVGSVDSRDETMSRAKSI